HGPHLISRGRPSGRGPRGRPCSDLFLGLSASAPQVQSGKLRALAVTGRQRVAEFSDVPTFRESGVVFGGLGEGAGFGIVAPTGTPAAVIEKLNGAVNQVLMDPKTRSGFETKAFATVVGGRSEERRV